MLFRIYRFYREGFANMSGQSRKLWLIILIKLFIMFAILKVFFFPDFLASKANTEEQKIEYIEKQIIPDYE